LRVLIRLAIAVCSEDADVVFLSSDHILFKIHAKNLETHCGAGFPPSNIMPLEGEKIPLAEDSQTLEQLFAFIYPRPLPDLNGDAVSFELLEKVAVAAEKYEVFVAMSICRFRMK
jgi:hypothetical protein